MRKKSTRYFKTTAKFPWLVNDGNKTVGLMGLRQACLLTRCLVGADKFYVKQTVPPTPGPNEKIVFKWMHMSTKACFRPVTVPSVKHEA